MLPEWDIAMSECDAFSRWYVAEWNSLLRTCRDCEISATRNISSPDKWLEMIPRVFFRASLITRARFWRMTRDSRRRSCLRT